MRVAVVVLGDLGRSPRIQYHARSLAEQGAFVDLIGCEGTPVWVTLREHPRVTIHSLQDPLSASRTTRFSRFLRGVRMGSLGSELLRRLLSVPRPDVILAQNPPALPTLPIVLAAARLRGARLVVDWHNFGASMLALQGVHPELVRLARGQERWFGRRAAAHLCVSKAMAKELSDHWDVPSARVVYDQPAREFARVDSDRARELFRRLGLDLSGLDLSGLELEGDRTMLSRNRLRAGGPAILVSSTSWSADEDLDLLLDAAIELDRTASAPDVRARFPDVHILVTGQGPMRARFEARVAGLDLQRVKLQAVWLSFEDYAALLGAADLGLCLHRSASGWDLPMKVADMQGAGLPVCALDYGPTLLEKVTPGHDGVLFKSAGELAARLGSLLADVATTNDALFELHANVQRRPRPRWDDEWRSAALPVILGTDS